MSNDDNIKIKKTPFSELKEQGLEESVFLAEFLHLLYIVAKREKAEILIEDNDN